MLTDHHHTEARCRAIEKTLGIFLLRPIGIGRKRTAPRSKPSERPIRGLGWKNFTHGATRIPHPKSEPTADDGTRHRAIRIEENHEVHP
jgi:hypothetical protein